MNKEYDTLTISKLISVLNEYKRTLGDIQIFHQSDPEGNSFGTITERSIDWYDTQVGRALFIMPFEEGIEVD